MELPAFIKQETRKPLICKIISHTVRELAHSVASIDAFLDVEKKNMERVWDVWKVWGNQDSHDSLDKSGKETRIRMTAWTNQGRKPGSRIRNNFADFGNSESQVVVRMLLEFED